MERLDRINELARKQRGAGLTEEEKAEQQVLRAAYLKQFRANFRATIERVVLVDEDGTQTPVSHVQKGHSTHAHAGSCTCEACRHEH